MPYYEIQIKQLLAESVDKFEVVFNSKTEDEFVEPVEFFALCDLLERPCQGEENLHLDDFIGVILPVIFNDDEGLQPELLSCYKPGSQQEVQLRKKEKA